MLLHSKETGSLVKILDTTELINPLKETVHGQLQEGQEEQPPEEFNKSTLIFPSGENLPQCWINDKYRKA
ncbi:MAG: acetyltransferase [Elainellaceae cyanobacterium]